MCDVWHWIGLGIVWLFCIPVNIICIIVNIHSYRRWSKKTDELAELYLKEINAIQARIGDTALTDPEE